MKVFSYKFSGMYPVGAVAIASAESKEEAAKLFKQKLKDEGFEQEIKPHEIEEFDSTKPNAKILLDGDY